MAWFWASKSFIIHIHLFSAAVTESQSLGNLQRAECIWLTIEVGKFEMKVRAPSEGLHSALGIKFPTQELGGTFHNLSHLRPSCRSPAIPNP